MITPRNYYNIKTFFILYFLFSQFLVDRFTFLFFIHLRILNTDLCVGIFESAYVIVTLQLIIAFYTR